MHKYNILSEHIAKSIIRLRNTLAPSSSLSYALWRQETKYRINYLRDDHWDNNIFSRIKLFSYLQASERK